MKLLGLFFSFISILATAYILFISKLHSVPLLLPIGAMLGIAYLTSGYWLMVGKRMGLTLGVFITALTVGISGYFLANHYFSVGFPSQIPDLIMLGFSLIAFLISLSQSPFQYNDNSPQQP